MTQDYTREYQDKLRTIPEALSTIQSGDCIFTTNNYSEPAGFLSELHTIADHVEGVKVWKGRSGEYPFMSDPAMKGHIEMYTYFMGPLFYKKSQPLGLVEYVPTDLANYYYVAVAGHPASVYVTDFGVAKLKGLSVTERAKALIAIAHPEQREELTADAKKMGLI